MQRLTPDKEHLVLDNLNMVHYVVQRQMHIPVGHPSYEDYIQEGTIGLILSAIRFDESRGFQFSTYAFPMIAGSVRRYRRDSEYGIKCSRSLKDVLFKVLSFQAKGMSLEDIEQTQEITSQEIHDVLCIASIGSLDKPIELKDGTITAGELIEDPNVYDIEDILSEEHILACIQTTSDSLNSKWKKDVWEEYIYGLLYGEKFNQSYFAQKYGLAQATVSRALKECKTEFMRVMSQ